MCGVAAICGSGHISEQLYDALTVLQHRGQDAAGIVTYDTETDKIYQHKDNGLVYDVFNLENITNLKGRIGIGHVRYPTAGSYEASEAQPFYVNNPYGIALAHNGNLVNSAVLAEELCHEGVRHINTNSDSELLLNVFAQELFIKRETLKCELLVPDIAQIFDAVSRVYQRCHGAYSVVALIANYGIVAFRDPRGIRPLIYGQRKSDRVASGVEYMIASESVALDALGFEKVRDIKPGEAIFIDTAGYLYEKICADKSFYRTCIFEYVYFSRPDSIIDEVFVHQARMRMGVYLAKKIKREWSDYNIDVVMPIPDTSRTSAVEIALQLNVACREGFIKNRYIGRTFIMPGYSQRNKRVRQKLNPLGVEFKGKNVLLVDDSIVRGTTSKEIVQMARRAGAKEVYFASASPPICYPNIYGIDMPSDVDLIAAGKTEQQICDAIGADRLIYQDLKDLIKSVCEGNPKLKKFECSIFNGEYADKLDKNYFANLHETRSNCQKPCHNEHNFGS